MGDDGGLEKITWGNDTSLKFFSLRQLHEGVIFIPGLLWGA